MRKAILFSVLFSALPLLSQAQDDLYFTPSKAEQSAYQQAKIEAERSDYYSGIGKTDEEYNRRGQYTYKKIGVDSLGNDIFMSKVSTQHGDSVVLDTIYSGFTRKYEGYNDDFAYSRRLSRFDGFWGGYYDPWLAGRSSFYLGWGWHSPYYGYSTWYDPWYDDPFYYGYYGGYSYYSYYGRYPYYGYPYYYGYARYGWYSPWDSYYAWGYPYYGYRRVYYSHNGHTGTANHWGNAPRSFGNQSRSRAYNDYGQPGYSTPRNNIGQNQYDRSMDTYQSQFGGARQIDYNNQSRQAYSRPDNSFSQPSRSSFGETTRGSFGGGNFGGSRAGGSSFGASRSGFGGHR